MAEEHPIRRIAPVAFLLRALLIGWALFMVFLTRMPSPTFVALVLFGVCLLLPEILPPGARAPIQIWSGAAAWLSSLFIPISLLFAPRNPTLAETYYAVVAWLIAAAAGITSNRATGPGVKRSWKALAITWAYVGAFLWLAAAYIQNLKGPFYVGLALACAVVILTELCFRLRAWSIIGLNTLLGMLILLPLVDFLTRAPVRIDPHPEIAGNAYLFDVARKDPHAFLFWWGKYLSQYDKLMRDIFIPDPNHVLPYRTRTNSHTTFFQSQIHINSLGFRGREVAREKGDVYRIVAIGESNTFGFTLTPEHLPWPEFLEQFIKERLHTNRQVEVITPVCPIIISNTTCIGFACKFCSSSPI